MMPPALRPFILASALAAAATPALAQERQWNLDVADQDAFLVFGVPESDDVGVSLWCKLGSKSVRLFTPVPAGKVADGKQVSFTAKVGNASFPLRGVAAANKESGVSSVEAELKADAPLLKAMQTGDRLTLDVRGHSATFPLTDANVGDLLKLCQANVG